MSFHSKILRVSLSSTQQTPRTRCGQRSLGTSIPEENGQCAILSGASLQLLVFVTESRPLNLCDCAVRTVQVTDYMDPVPHLTPSWLLGYRHAGPEAHVQEMQR